MIIQSDWNEINSTLEMIADPSLTSVSCRVSNMAGAQTSTPSSVYVLQGSPGLFIIVTCQYNIKNVMTNLRVFLIAASLNLLRFEF